MMEYPEPSGPIEGNVAGVTQDGAARICVSDACRAHKTHEQQDAAMERFLDLCARIAARQAADPSAGADDCGRWRVT